MAVPVEIGGSVEVSHIGGIGDVVEFRRDRIHLCLREKQIRIPVERVHHEDGLLAYRGNHGLSLNEVLAKIVARCVRDLNVDVIADSRPRELNGLSAAARREARKAERSGTRAQRQPGALERADPVLDHLLRCPCQWDLAQLNAGLRPQIGGRLNAENARGRSVGLDHKVRRNVALCARVADDDDVVPGAAAGGHIEAVRDVGWIQNPHLADGHRADVAQRSRRAGSAVAAATTTARDSEDRDNGDKSLIHARLLSRVFEVIAGLIPTRPGKGPFRSPNSSKPNACLKAKAKRVP